MILPGLVQPTVESILLNLLPVPNFFPPNPGPRGVNPATLLSVPATVVLHLYTECRPWEVLTKRLPDPISYKITDPRFAGVEAALQAYLARFSKALWERTHWISLDQDRDLALARKQAYSHRHRLLLALLKEVVLLLVHGVIDIDFLLEPRLMIFPQDRWGWAIPSDPADVAEDLQRLDRIEPWRNYFVHAPEQHPARKDNATFTRIHRKFFPPETSS